MAADVIDITERLASRNNAPKETWTIIYLSSETELECIGLVQARDAEEALNRVEVPEEIRGRGALLAVRGPLFVEFI